MNMNLANLFFTPQAGNGGMGASSSVMGKGGIFATSGGNFMDMIFARLLQEAAAGQPVTDINAGEENKVGMENIISVLAPAQSGKGGQKEKFQQVHLNHILHKLAHEISATIPDTGLMRQDDGSAATDLQKELHNLIARLQAETDENTAPMDNAATPAEEAVPLPEPQRRNFMAFLNGLLQGIPEENRPAVIKLPTGLLRKTVQHLEFNPAPATTAQTSADETGMPTIPADEAAPPEDGGETPAPALIATGLSPESLTRFMEELSQRLQHGESFIVGMVKIMPPQSKQEMIFTPRALILPPANKNTNPAPAPLGGDNAIIASGDEIEPGTDPLLSLLIPSAVETPQLDVAPVSPSEEKKPQRHETPLLALLAALQTAAPQSSAPGQTKKTEAAQTNTAPGSGAADDHKMEPLLPREIVARLNALVIGSDPAPQTNTGLPLETDFSRVLKVLEEAQQKTADKNPSGLDKAVNVIKSAGPALSTFHANGAFPAMGMAFAAALSGDIFPDGWDWSRFNGTAGQPMAMHSPAMMAASLVSQASNATTPHPATQIVAATITKAAATGENRNITVRLEPPELGRVEIRMEFGKDKAVKTHIIAEKQETYLMLQRDAHILDRTLHDAGLDTDGGVSFELAQDGGAFDDGRNGQRGSSGGGDSANGTEIAEETIETAMDWYVDPDTGLTRYDIMA